MSPDGIEESVRSRSETLPFRMRGCEMSNGTPGSDLIEHDGSILSSVCIELLHVEVSAWSSPKYFSSAVLQLVTLSTSFEGFSD